MIVRNRLLSCVQPQILSTTGAAMLVRGWLLCLFIQYLRFTFGLGFCWLNLNDIDIQQKVNFWNIKIGPKIYNSNFNFYASVISQDFSRIYNLGSKSSYKKNSRNWLIVGMRLNYDLDQLCHGHLFEILRFRPANFWQSLFRYELSQSMRH